MTKRGNQRPDLKAIPMFKHESLYIGIDVGKVKHVAGFMSAPLLERYGRFEACPALAFENSREGFHALVERMRSFAPLEHIFVLIERTGHYHRVLQQYLQELDLPVYVIHVHERRKGMIKTNKQNALGLPNTPTSQLDLRLHIRHNRT